MDPSIETVSKPFFTTLLVELINVYMTNPDQTAIRGSAESLPSYSVYIEIR